MAVCFEPFLLDVQKILPIFEGVDQPIRPAPSYLGSRPDTQSLLQEFETVYDVVELTHGQLTPPQSPPTDSKVLITLEPLHAASPDIAHELAVVDELVRTRVEDMQWSTSPPSPASNTSGSFGDVDSSSGTDDPEWAPEPVQNFIAQTPTRKRGRSSLVGGGVDKKSRKKEQNKNAATRYRMKKKAEVEVILGEEKELQQRNEELGSKITDMRREIKYLKGLMRDLLRAKGLIN